MFFGTGELKSQIGTFSIRVLYASMCVLAVLSGLLSVPSRAQSSDDTIRVSTELTAVEVTVTDRDGKPVSGLTAKDFRLFENGNDTEISFFEPVRREDRNRPLAIVFALDVSGSMTADEMRLLRDELRRFIHRLAGLEAYFALLTFGMEVKTIQEFTNQRKTLERAYERLIRADDGLSTHAYDAVDSAIRLLSKKSPRIIRNKFPKRAVILVTDGFPVGDIVSPATVAQRANEAETTIYSLILPSFSRLQGKKKPLPTLLEASGLIEKTGGKSFYVNETNLAALFESLAIEITSSYVLAFYPEQTGAGSEDREIRVEAGGYRIRQNRTRFRRIVNQTRTTVNRQ